jgi:putative peptidoglycan lipid II flippase
VVANQAALLVVLILANRVDGGVSAYTGAFIFFLLPHALFAVSIMTTLVPELAAAAGHLDWAGFRSRFSMGLRLMALVVFPAACGYVVLAHPIVTALLEHGALSKDAADLAGDVLMGFGVGLPGFSVYLFTLRGFYAMHDTRTPFFLNLFQNGLQIGLCFALQPLLGVPGLSLAYGLAYTGAALVALWVLKSRVGSLDARRVGRTIGKILIACAALSLAVLGIAGRVGGDAGVGALVRTTVGLVVGGVAYVVAVLLLRVDEVVLLRDRLLRRLRPGGAARTPA